LRVTFEIVDEMLAPGCAALEDERRVELVRTLIDPFAQALAARLRECGALERAVFQNDDIPAEIAEQGLEARPQAFADDGIETLPVVVDDPPAVIQVLLPVFEDRLEDVALIQLRIADERDHPARWMVEAPAMRAHVILHERGEQGLRYAEADRARRKVD